MTSPNDPVTPTPFNVAQPAAGATGTAKPSNEQSRWLLPGLAFLLILALAVVFWLPSYLSGPATSPPASPAAVAPSVATGSAAPPAQPTEPAASPWSDAQQARLRKEAQEVLAQLVELQFSLESVGAATWASAALDSAKATAKGGDGHYQAREFVAAKEQYQDSLQQLQALDAQRPDILTKALQAASEAIEAGDAEALQPPLATAELLAPGSPDLAQLKARVAVMEPLQAQLDTAQAAERAGELAAAEAALIEATQLDPASQRASQALARVQVAHAAQRYQRAMSEGYAALDDGRFDAAGRAFKAARTLQPNNPEIDAAAAELASAQTASRLGKLQREARQLEGEEAWSEAVTRYEEALKVDATLVFAQEGLARAQPRASLDKQLRATLAAPERLADPAVAQNLEQLLAQARALEPRGATLSTQLDELSRLLTVANTPVTVTLRSDQVTSVIVQRVARLGQFAEHSLSLRPGTYTAVGTRDGYRDVRETFTVSASSAAKPILIACTDAI